MLAGVTSCSRAHLQWGERASSRCTSACPALRPSPSAYSFSYRVGLSASRPSQAATRSAHGSTRSRGALTIVASMKVAVTGGGGRTGGLTVQRLLKQPEQFSVTAIVRSEESADKLKGAGVPADQIVIIDITAPDAEEKLKAAFKGTQAVVVATSGVPQMAPKEADAPPGPPTFFYPEGQMPEQVDYEGQVAQIEAAKAAGVKHVVIISSMGGTDESNRLNSLGGGNILIWKRKAEQHLIASGLTYTIIHPGGLFDEDGGQREIVLGVDDELLQRAEKEGTSRRIPRDDVAALTVAALTLDSAKNRSVDAIAKEPGTGEPTTDFDALYSGLQGNCKY